MRDREDRVLFLLSEGVEADDLLAATILAKGLTVQAGGELDR